MRKWTSIWLGFVVGLAFGGWLFFRNPQPAICILLETPLMWICNYIDSLHLGPRDAIGGLILVIPLLLIYWACLGALVGFLLQSLFWLFRKLRHRDDAYPGKSA